MSFYKYMKNNCIKINFNWANIIVYSFFLCYGFYGAFTLKYNSEMNFIYDSLIQSIVIIIPFVIFSIIAGLRLEGFRDSITLHKKDILIYLLFLGLFAIISLDRLNFSLFSDEISYAGTAHGQAIHILTVLSRHFNLPDFNFQYIVQFVSLMLLLGLVLFYMAIKNLEWRYKVIVISFAIIISRVVFILNGGNASPHPPMHLFPSFVFGSFFGIRDIVFKAGQLAIYAVFIVVLYKMFTRKISKNSVSLVLAFYVGTLPLSLEMSTVIEHSIWAYYIFVIVMMELMTSSSPNYIRLISLVSLGALMRQPVIVAIIPIALVFIKDKFYFRTFLNKIGDYLRVFSPLLLFLPFLFKSVVFGTSAIESPLDNTSFLNRILEAFQSDVIYVSAFNVIPFWWIAAFPFAFLVPYRKNKVMALAFLLFFVMLILVFYSIKPGLWGMAKYQIEIIAPFVVIGVSSIVFYLVRKERIRYLLIFILSFAALFNISYFENKIKQMVLGENITSYVMLPYNLRDAYRFIKSKGLSSGTYSIGSTYGIMPEIMNGYTTSELLSARDIYIQQNKEFPTIYEYANSINNNLDISTILIGFSGNKDELINEFLSLGWVMLRKFDNSAYHTFVVVMQRRTKIDTAFDKNLSKAVSIF